jgi:hypothetical protein
MRIPLIAVVLAIVPSNVVLAQRAASGPPAAAGVPADGPLLGPPVIDIPEVPPGPTPSSSANPGQRRRLFRLPSTKSGQQASAPTGKLLPGRWKQPAAGTPPEAQALAPDTAIDPQSSASKAAPAPKRLFSPRRYGPVEVFPKPRDSDRTGNPLSLRRPMLAW